MPGQNIYAHFSGAADSIFSSRVSSLSYFVTVIFVFFVSFLLLLKYYSILEALTMYFGLPSKLHNVLGLVFLRLLFYRLFAVIYIQGWPYIIEQFFYLILQESIWILDIKWNQEFLLKNSVYFTSCFCLKNNPLAVWQIYFGIVSN